MPYKVSHTFASLALVTTHLTWFHLDATMVGVIIRFYQLGYYVDIGQSVFGCEVLVHLVLKCTVETLHH